MSPRSILISIVTVVALIFFAMINPFTTIGAGARGVVLTWSAFEGEVLDPGLHWITPFAQRVIEIDVQTQKDEVTATAASKDLQTVTAVVALNYHIDPSNVGKLYQSIGLDYSSRIIAPAIQEAVKATTAKYTAVELITNRQMVKEEARSILAERLIKTYIVVDDVSFANFDFSPAFNAAIEAKQVAEQETRRQENLTKQEEEKKKQEILKAQALAEKSRLEAQALSVAVSADALIRKLEAEAKLEAAKRWNGQLPTTMVPGGAVPFLNLK
jgi:regulator of protease activity HflC (stomatin/prohibitin superfamily)